MSTTNSAASTLGKLRWAGTTEEDRREFAASGGHARKAALTAERRKAIAVKASKAAAKVRKKAARQKKSASRKSKG